jgi:hypothetical protein
MATRNVEKPYRVRLSLLYTLRGVQLEGLTRVKIIDGRCIDEYTIARQPL